MITPFLSHSLRRLLHAEQEGKILKNISAGQNLEVDLFFLLFIYVAFSEIHQVKHRTWLILRDEGAIIEEATEDDDTEESSEPKSFDEKGDQLSQNIALHVTPSHQLLPSVNGGSLNAGLGDSDVG